MTTLPVLAPITAAIITLAILAYRYHHKHRTWHAHWYCLKCGASEHITTQDGKQAAENIIHNSALNHSIEHQYGYVQPKTTVDKPPTILVRGPGFEPLPHPLNQGETNA